ncbi:MAG: hypothetical protein REI11_07995, partial [Patulibacter sp.]|nr:hypothetical protein [Patulibacter sp.]
MLTALQSSAARPRRAAVSALLAVGLVLGSTSTASAATTKDLVHDVLPPSVARAVDPVVDAAAPATDPVTQAAAPVTDPVVAAAAPVTHAVDHATEPAVAAVTRAVEPVTAPVVHAAATDIVAPAARATAPATRAVADVAAPTARTIARAADVPRHHAVAPAPSRPDTASASTAEITEPGTATGDITREHGPTSATTTPATTPTAGAASTFPWLHHVRSSALGDHTSAPVSGQHRATGGGDGDPVFGGD